MVAENKSEKKNLPWVEKYRPYKLTDLISHKDIISTIERFVREDSLPHLLFYGPPGTGKTSTILACARQLYPPKQFATMVLELNASDDRGIDVVRNQIMSFANSKTIFSAGFKLVILDEADAMTRDAQNALRRIIEKYTSHVRFCLICNYLGKIIPAIQSRCTRFRFGPLTKQQMQPLIQKVVADENVKCSEHAVKTIANLAQGDMRKALNILQSAALATDGVIQDANTIYVCIGHPQPLHVEMCIDSMLNKDIAGAYEFVQRICTNNGYALIDIIYEIHEYMMLAELPAPARILLLEKMGEIEHRLCSGTSDKLQLGALVSLFYDVRKIVSKVANEQGDASPEDENMDSN